LTGHYFEGLQIGATVYTQGIKSRECIVANDYRLLENFPGDGAFSMSGMSGKLNHGWRVAATGFVFVVFGLGALFISVTMFPLLRLSAWDRDVARRRIQRGMQLTFKVYMELMRSLGILTYSVEGLERLRQPGRLIIANHPTLIDVVLLGSLLPEVDCIVKRGLWRNPFLRWPVSWAGYIPNSEGEELVSRCAATLRQGHSLLVFPEGTRTVPGQSMRLQRGAAHIALAADADILPVKISCDPITLFRQNPWYRVPVRRFHMHVAVGMPVSAHEFRAAGEASSRSARRLSQWMLDYYADSPAMHPRPLTEPEEHDWRHGRAPVASTEMPRC
jgi:1-acyl-sn-glycerol-3-phosphate acyltransferase